MSYIEIAAGTAESIQLESGNRCRVINRFGGQVVDTWALVGSDFDEYLSMEHSRSANYKLLFEPGDRLYSNNFKPLLQIVADTSPGIHDTLHAACSKGSYRYYGAEKDTPNCQDNLITQMKRQAIDLRHVPCPWNLFEHTLVADHSTFSDEPSAAKPGDYIELEALVGLLLVFSACPSTVGQISGEQPRGARIEIL